ncbi:cysteine desulfurase [Luteolibacter ambystomatis]|uniref:cysteine desulfurase n=2 Tax=Luteolibacter ambystomatis TaxID=2824561 RepID=A0A975PGI3_9BACT|nr:cysteine desulfurase [Luteolibacter ambystomatis]QUE52332.1 cysteine desulfurase [Luteolibacter ambystomatis]
MSIPRLELPGSGSPVPGDPFGTELIGRLANEFFREDFQSPVQAPDLPLVSRETVAEKPEAGLSGGFPTAASSATPPVHPTVVGAAPGDVDDYADSGGHESGSADSYEFGEPRSYADGLHGHVAESRGRDLPADRNWRPEPEPPASVPGANETQYYFLQGVRDLSAPMTEEAVASGVAGLSPFDVSAIRKDFPALHQRVNGRPLVWLDNAATTHKPHAVIDATSSFYSRDNSNIHRAAHQLAERSTALFEAGREKVQRFLGAADKHEIVFLRGTTEAINLIANSYGRQNIGEGDEIILTTLEHHANIVPWQLLAQQTGAVIRVVPINDRGELILEEFVRLLNPRTKIVSITHVSNALGTVNPVEQIIQLAHAHGVPVVVDGAQSTPHIPINVTALDADFFVFSAHKIFGPTGIGALYAKRHLLEAMPPWQGGGHMIKDVTFERTIYQSVPEKFEAGTPDIAGVVGLGAAVDYLMALGIPALAAYEHSLLEYAMEALATVTGLKPIGTAANKASVLSFVIPGIPNDKIAQHLDQHGIAVRAGHHCALPAQRHFGLETTVRPSLAFYNTHDEVDLLVEVLKKLPKR